MTGYTELVKALRHCTDNEPSNGDCWNCPYQGEKCHTLLSNAAAAIEALQAEAGQWKAAVKGQEDGIKVLQAEVERLEQKRVRNG